MNFYSRLTCLTAGSLFFSQNLVGVMYQARHFAQSLSAFFFFYLLGHTTLVSPSSLIGTAIPPFCVRDE